MFLGREDELQGLSDLWKKSTASLVTCRGRRRIGKSTLIEEFAARSKVRFIEIAGEAPRPGMTNADQLASFGKQLAAQTGCDRTNPPDWFEAFRTLNAELDTRKTVVFLDEISWMGQYDKGFAGELKTAWDTMFKKHPRLIMVICGSVSTWIEANILNNTGFVGRASQNLVIGELPLVHCRRFWGRASERIAPREILDVLSVTGGIPRYLEEIDPALSAAENIRRLCFRPKGILRDDFSKIFNSVFGENATYKNQILTALADAPMTLSEIAAALEVERSGIISGHLSELETAGFITEDAGLNPATGKPAKCVRYRISDNYTRFYLRYIRPNERMIDRDAFRFSSLDALPGWDTILGLQFENLVINNLPALLPRLGLDRVLLLSAAPWRQPATARKRGCQVDLLLQSERSVYIVEIKRRQEIGREVEDEVAAKVRALALPRDKSVRTALVYDGRLAPTVEANGYFDAVIPVADLLS